MWFYELGRSLSEKKAYTGSGEVVVVVLSGGGVRMRCRQKNGPVWIKYIVSHFFDDIEPEKGSNTQRLNEELPLHI